MRTIFRAVAGCVLAAASIASGRAEPRTVTWTSYLRAGPGLQFAETDEVQGGGVVDVLACAGGWCRVLDGGAAGYLEADRVPASSPAGEGAASPAAGRPAPACFDAKQTGFRAPVDRFCSQLTRKN